MFLTIRRVTFLIALLAAIPVARGQHILSNYPPTNDTNTTADVDNLRWKALSFAMPPSTSATVGNLTVRLGNYAAAADMPIFEIRDHTGSTTAPGPNALLSFTAPGPGTAAIQDFTFTPASTFTLTGGTSYWILMRGADATTSVDWRGSSPAIIPTGIAVYGGQSLFTSNGGTSWTTSATINSLRLEVIPEPGALGLTALGLAVLGARARRQRAGR